MVARVFQGHAAGVLGAFLKCMCLFLVGVSVLGGNFRSLKKYFPPPFRHPRSACTPTPPLRIPSPLSPKFFRGRPRGMSVPKCSFFQDLEGLTEVSGRMSAGISGQKLPLWAEYSFLTTFNKKTDPPPPARTPPRFHCPVRLNNKIKNIRNVRQVFLS